MTFVGHDASRTGAPAVLRSFLRWRAAERPGPARLVLLRGGPLTDDLRRCTPTFVADGTARRATRLVAAGVRSVRPGAPGWLDLPAPGRAIRSHRPDVVVAASLASLDATVRAVGGRVPIVCHVHELDGVGDRVLPPGPRRHEALGAVARFVAAGPAVARMLVERWSIPAEHVVVVDEFVDRPHIGDHEVAAARAELDLDPGTPLVVGCGAPGPRKGTDHFLSTVAALPRGATGPVAAWIGGDRSSAAWDEAERDVAAARLGGRVHLVASRPDARPWLAAADVVLTTSREDPYPLVALEAAALGTAVVGFASGGFADAAAAAELAEDAVAVGDVLALADRLAPLLASKTESRRRGAQFRSWVLSTHLTEHLAPRLWDAIAEVA
jgi:glycosyltransferase involved in cell wall biosynthesis